MTEKIEFQAEQAGERLDVFLSRKQAQMSRSHIQRLVLSGDVLVNAAVQKARYKLKTGDTVTLQLPEPELIDVEAEDIPLDILYEDEDIIVINKARGMVVHPAAGVFQVGDCALDLLGVLFICRQFPHFFAGLPRSSQDGCSPCRIVRHEG